MQRWDPMLHEYHPYTVPADWNCPIFLDDMEAPINCANCGAIITGGDGYTSLEIHNHMGLAHIVCEKCYDEEWKRRLAAMQLGEGTETE